MAKKRKNLKHKLNRHGGLAKAWSRYQYKHTTLALALIVFFILAIDTAIIKALFEAVENAGLLGIFITGMFFVSFFTAAPATVILLSETDLYNPFLLSAIAGAGALVGDWIILHLIEENVAYELRPLAKKYGVLPIIRQMKAKRFRPIAVITGLLFIASPGPDEVGLGLLGLSKIPSRKLLPLLYVLNTGGIFILVASARAISNL